MTVLRRKNGPKFCYNFWMESNYGQNRRTARTFALSLTMIVLNGPTRGSLSVSKSFFFHKNVNSRMQICENKRRRSFHSMSVINSTEVNSRGDFFLRKKFWAVLSVRLFVCVFVSSFVSSFRLTACFIKKFSTNHFGTLLAVTATFSFHVVPTS